MEGIQQPLRQIVAQQSGLQFPILAYVPPKRELPRHAPHPWSSRHGEYPLDRLLCVSKERFQTSYLTLARFIDSTFCLSLSTRRRRPVFHPVIAVRVHARLATISTMMEAQRVGLVILVSACD